MSAAWVVVPLLPIIVVILFAVVLAIALFSLISTIGTTPITRPASFSSFLAFILLLYAFIYVVIPVVIIVYAIMFYKFVKRRNTHFTRQILVYEDLITLVKQLSSKRGVDISIPVNYLERSLREARLEETEKNAALYAILSSFQPIVAFYAYYFLMKDFFKHERREDLFIAGVTNILATLGVAINLPRRASPIPDRSFAVYFIASLFTAGIFTIYWIYVLVSDPNSHFRYQSFVEDTIIAQVSPIMI